MTRCETSRLGDIPCLVSCLPQRMLHDNIKTFDVIFKKMEEESTRAVELALEGHNLFISGQKHNFRTASNLRIIGRFSAALSFLLLLLLLLLFFFCFVFLCFFFVLFFVTT